MQIVTYISPSTFQQTLSVVDDETEIFTTQYTIENFIPVFTKIVQDFPQITQIQIYGNKLFTSKIRHHLINNTFFSNLSISLKGEID